MTDTIDTSTCGACEVPDSWSSGTDSGGDSGDDTGSGGWDGSEPGNGGFLGAKTVPGGIRLSWEYPTTNPHAVAHVLVYKSASDSFSTAWVRTLIGGNEFTDWIDSDTERTYFYWVRFVSLSGDKLTPIGSASALHDPSLVADEEPSLGPVSLSDLTSDLQTLLGRIEPLEQALASEVLTLEEADSVLALALDDLNRTVTDKLATMQTQVDAVANIHTEYEDITNGLVTEVEGKIAEMVTDVETMIAENQAQIEVMALTQAQYDGITTPDSSILYVITD